MGGKMEISSRIEGDIAILNLRGRLDLTSATELKNASKDIMNLGNRKLIFNMGRVDFINSSGLGTLVSILKDVRSANGRMKLSNLAPYVKEIFEITQLTNIFDICEDEKNACRSFQEAVYLS
jgi:stage II sporulation protein AA (anti-sigma F factor antagonist)